MPTLFPHIKSHARMIPVVAGALALFSAILPFPAESIEVTVVKNAELKPYRDVVAGFEDACGCNVRELKLGEEEGREVVLEEKPDVVIVIGTTVFKKVRSIKDRPLIYTMVVPSEVNASLQPNISGVSMDISPTTYIRSMLEVFPNAKKIGVLYDPQHTGRFVEEAVKAARAAGIELISKQVRDPSKIAGFLEEMHDRADIFWMLPDPTLVTPEAVDCLLRFSFQYKLPVFSFSKKYVEMGAIAALDVDPYDMGVQAGEIVQKLSKGQAGPIRVYARRAHLTINRNVAAKMGLRYRVK